MLDLMQRTNFDQTPGYGEDAYCAKAAAQIRLLCDAPDADVHFFVGATQANRRLLPRHCGRGRACCALTQATSMSMRQAPSGHRPQMSGTAVKAGKITVRQIRKAVEEHRTNASHEHEVQPGMVYLQPDRGRHPLYKRRS